MSQQRQTVTILLEAEYELGDIIDFGTEEYSDMRTVIAYHVNGVNESTQVVNNLHYTLMDLDGNVYSMTQKMIENNFIKEEKKT